MPTVLSNDFRRQWAETRAEMLDAFEAVGSSGWYILGSETEQFEQALARYWGLPYAVGVASGLDALEISLRILGCRAGDRVLTTPVSAFATTLAIVKAGAVPVFAPVDNYGLNCLDACEQLLARRPEIRFFVPVHLYGHSLNMGRLRELRERFALNVIEDCAQSIGAYWRGTPTGTAGQIAATSFYPTKNLGALGDGGAILTGDAAIAGLAAEYRNYGESGKYCHKLIGYNSRLDELQAALLRRVSLGKLAAWISRRREIARYYIDHISNPHIQVPGSPDGSDSTWHLFPVLVEAERKREFMAYMSAQSIAVAEHYPSALFDQPAMSTVSYELADGAREARAFCAREVSLPVHPYLTEDEIAYVAEACNSWRPE